MKAVLNPILRSARITDGDDVVDVFFKELDEWQTVVINSTRVFVHFDYESKDNFIKQKDWLHYMLQAYTDNGQYDNQLITYIKLEL
jgi:hypothetical protein